jgi:plasmid stability protein
MSAMTLRNLDPRVAEILRQRAASEGRSPNSLICDVLEREAEDELRRQRMREQRPEAAAIRRRIKRRFGAGTPSEELVRNDRRR